LIIITKLFFQCSGSSDSAAFIILQINFEIKCKFQYRKTYAWFVESVKRHTRKFEKKIVAKNDTL